MIYIDTKQLINNKGNLSPESFIQKSNKLIYLENAIYSSIDIQKQKYNSNAVVGFFVTLSYLILHFVFLLCGFFACQDFSYLPIWIAITGLLTFPLLLIIFYFCISSLKTLKIFKQQKGKILSIVCLIISVFSIILDVLLFLSLFVINFIFAS